MGRPPRAQRRRLFWPAVLVVSVLASAGLFAAALAGRHGAEPAAAAGASSYGDAPSYRLTDQVGRSVTSASLHGRIQVVSFLFPYCTTYCPITGREMARLAHQIDTGPWRGKVSLVTFNVDPAGATLTQLQRFMTQYGADPHGTTWEFLTGTPAQINDVVVGGFHVYMQRVLVADEQARIAAEKKAGTYVDEPVQPNAVADAAHVNYDVVHNDYVEIVDGDGHVLALADQASTLPHSRLVAAIDAALAGKPVVLDQTG